MEELRDFQQTIQDKIIEDYQNQIEKYIINGLKRKGYNLKNKVDLYEFVKLNCRCEDRVQSKIRIYYVNDIPFLQQDYNSDIRIKEDHSSMQPIKIKASFGYYKYL